MLGVLLQGWRTVGKKVRERKEPCVLEFGLKHLVAYIGTVLLSVMEKKISEEDQIFPV